MVVAVFGKFTITEMFTFVKLGEDSTLAEIWPAFYMLRERGVLGTKYRSVSGGCSAQNSDMFGCIERYNYSLYFLIWGGR